MDDIEKFLDGNKGECRGEYHEFVKQTENCYDNEDGGDGKAGVEDLKIYDKME